MPEPVTIEELQRKFIALREQFVAFRDAAIVEIAQLQLAISQRPLPLQPTTSEFQDYPPDDMALLERERVLRQKLGLPVRDQYPA